jgi:hypothetical protein
MIIRSKSTTHGRLEGASTVGPPLYTNRKCAILRTSITLLCLPHPHRTFFLKGMILATTRVTRATVAKIILKSRTWTKGSRSMTACEKRTQNSNRTYSNDEESYMIPRSLPASFSS